MHHPTRHLTVQGEWLPPRHDINSPDLYIPGILILILRVGWANLLIFFLQWWLLWPISSWLHYTLGFMNDSILRFVLVLPDRNDTKSSCYLFRFLVNQPLVQQPSFSSISVLLNWVVIFWIFRDHHKSLISSLMAVINLLGTYIFSMTVKYDLTFFLVWFYR